MLLATLAFFAGDLLLQTCARLPSELSLLIILILGVIFFIQLRKKHWIGYAIFSCALGFSYTAWYAHRILDWELSSELEGKPITITGHIASLPRLTRWDANFFFKMDSMQAQPTSTLLRLSTRQLHKRLMVGDQWQFLVRLKRVHGLRNPGGFDYEAWAVQRGLRANGSIIPSDNNKILAHDWYRYPIDHLRQKLQTRLQLYLPSSKTAPWLIALIMGERQGMSQQDWQVLRRTGTNHLMAIAGLHIGIIAGFAHILFNWLWRRSTVLLLVMPAQLASGAAALIVGIAYSALAGFSIPAQRASIMLCVFVSAVLSRRKINPWHVWATALLFVLLTNPLSVLTESFWLSFATIALIIYGMRGRLAPTGWWWKWGRVQWVIGFGLIPISLLFFQQAALTGFIANCIAIPWLGFLILPFCLCAAIFIFISPTAAKFFLLLADKSLTGLWAILTYFSTLPIAIWEKPLAIGWMLAASLTGIVFLLFPNGMPGRWLGLAWLLPVFLCVTPQPAAGEFWLTLLDVGQGLSTVVQTKSHTLVFDTGARLGEQMDMGESVVLPYLAARQIKKIDLLVISHGDNDHIGGAGAILRTLPVNNILTSVPHKLLPRASQLCLRGMAWQWDGVYFKILHPDQHQLALGNNSSCVLRIDNGKKAVLITGDIEKLAELSLLTNAYKDLHATTILIAPHHGSKTSGVPAFIQAVHPQFVLYATGYRNRYHFPHPSVVLAYQQIGSEQLDTAKTGSIIIKLRLDKNVIIPELYRYKYLKYYNSLTTLELQLQSVQND